MAQLWEDEYFWMKSSTNGIILTIALSSLLAIAAIGWSMTFTLRIAIFLMLMIIPSSHGLLGIYLSNSIEGADYCVNPVTNSLKIFHNYSQMDYFVSCPANSTLFGPPWQTIHASLSKALTLKRQLNDYAETLPEATRLHLQEAFLEPIGNQLGVLKAMEVSFANISDCATTKESHQEAAKTLCTYGILGMFSLWVHQLFLCLLLFLSVIALVSVYEDVRRKEDRIEMQYHFLASYEDDSMEHLYMTPE